MKKIVSMLIVCLIVLTSAISPSFASSEISIVIDGVQKNFDVMPQIIDGRTLVPMRAIFEEFGADIEWEEETRTVTATVNDTTVVLIVNYPRGKVNGEGIQLDVPPKIIDGRTMVPVRFIAEALGCKVEWVAETKTVVITGNGKNVASGEVAAADTVIPGEIAATDYVNKTIGYGFNLPDGWTFTSREEINALYGFVGEKMGYEDFLKIMEEQGSYTDMLAKSPQGENIQITVNQTFDIDEKEYCNMVSSQLKEQLTSYGFQVNNLYLCEKEVAGEMLNGIYMENSYQNVTVHQMVLCKKVNNYFILFTISAVNASNIDTIANNIFKA